MKYNESYINAGLSLVSSEYVKLAEQDIDGGGCCAITISCADRAISPNRTQGSSIMLPGDTKWKLSRNQEGTVGTDRLTIVLMAGLPGTGKTTLAYALQDLLGWRVIDKDWYKEKLLKEGFDDYHAGWEAYDYSFVAIRTTLAEQHTSVILDSATLHQFILNEALKIVCEVPNTLLKVILCVSNRDLRIKRLETRPFYHSNPKVDTAADVDDLYYFRHLPRNMHILSTDRPLAECLTEAKEYVLS